MEKHVLKCRIMYEREMKAKGEGVQRLRCRYNAGHLVPHVELMWHHEHCSDRENIIPDQFSFPKRAGKLL